MVVTGNVMAMESIGFHVWLIVESEGEVKSQVISGFLTRIVGKG